MWCTHTHILPFTAHTSNTHHHPAPGADRGNREPRGSSWAVGVIVQYAFPTRARRCPAAATLVTMRTSFSYGSMGSSEAPAALAPSAFSSSAFISSSEDMQKSGASWELLSEPGWVKMRVGRIFLGGNLTIEPFSPPNQSDHLRAKEQQKPKRHFFFLFFQRTKQQKNKNFSLFKHNSEFSRPLLPERDHGSQYHMNTSFRRGLCVLGWGGGLIRGRRVGIQIEML